MQTNNTKPKVSIGMAVYNGERFICRALDSLLSQTFTDFELIISDNASNDSTGNICQMYAAKDSRIKYTRQEDNQGALFNFNFVLEQAQSEYFMWAAHDDFWDNSFIEKIINKFDEKDDGVVAVCTEAQYTINLEKQVFFPEGKPFYNISISSPFKRVEYLLQNNYGNLFYSVFKTSFLFIDGESILSKLSQITLNEIPFLILVAESGNWIVIPEILFFKETNKATYNQAKWEKAGGKLPNVTLSKWVKKIRLSQIYHMKTFLDISQAVSMTKFNFVDKARLRFIAIYYLIKHSLAISIRMKKVKD